MPFNFQSKIGQGKDGWNALDHDHQKWNVLDGHAREAACMLGYTQEEWDSGKITNLLEMKNWVDLNAPQKDAAKVIGFNEDTLVLMKIRGHVYSQVSMNTSIMQRQQKKMNLIMDSFIHFSKSE